MATRFKTLRRLGLIENWNWPLLWFVLPLYVIFTILYDAVLTGNSSYLWIVTFVSASMVEITFVVICKKLFLERLLTRFPSGLIGGTFAGLVNVVRNCTVAFLALELGLLKDVDWLTRIIGAFFMGIALLIFFVSILGSRVEHNAVMNRQHTTQQLLLMQRQSANSLLTAENTRLLDHARGLLVPRIEKIQKLLLQQNAKDDTLQELLDLITQQVRPLSAELSSTAKNLTLKPAPEPVKRISTGFMTPNVRLKELIKPGLVLFLSGLGQWFTVNILVGIDKASMSIVGVLAGWFLMVVVKALIPSHLVVRRPVAIIALISLGLVSGIPVALINLSPTSSLSEWLLFSMVLIAPAMALMGFAISASLDAAREDAEKRIKHDNESLARETALFDQHMWLAKRNWSFVVHGTVQAALTAAITRLSSSDELEQYQINLVMQDLNRAAEALSKTPELDVNLPAAMNALIATWQGICEVEWSCTERANRVITRDVNTRMCVNEIVKEAVSNAVRHGEATKATISIDRTADELLLLTVSNNGRPVSEDRVEGVGSEMFEELTLEWSLTNQRSTGLTVLEAELALASIAKGTL